MQRSNGLHGFSPVLVLFIGLTTIFFVGNGLLQGLGADARVLLIGNAFLFMLTFISYRWARRGLNNPNPHAFVRAIYSGILLKLFISLMVATVYIAVYRKELNKPAFFTLMGLYLVYTFLEVSLLTKALKHQANA